MFNEGYTAHAGENLVRLDLCRESLRLGTLLASSPVCTPTIHALVALMAFQAALLFARVDSGGELILLEDQDRSLWDRNLIALGFRHFSECSEGAVMSPYHLQAGIAAAHTGAATSGAPDWPTILDLYDQLWELEPSPIVALNRVVAVARVRGQREALRELESLEENRSLRNYYLLPAVRAQLLLEIGDKAQAGDSFRSALELPCSEPERRFLQRKLAECD